ncbi:hypothetical protein PTTG_29057 [Puccinia triticina 1-1 BBBD Race 1]|uniref:Uncharacterized protein n=2 Tax=Puccinia triticina TaxID=208348 RepID=A0A180G6N2_PUCT1|nr:uncharacterized protein PtA15_7A538 [Puccinia triticina]OAV88347.1 hypothetical protein PTTG_29057 [Puccinia triticina 1-1 BBBD Race 1]WAQ86809.1 hypothetical protein PtA15_7A538 [Puccinia triticina]WAR56674.1 hypothetical protein PtB15_7B524 [Puccinia triticina]
MAGCRDSSRNEDTLKRRDHLRKSPWDHNLETDQLLGTLSTRERPGVAASQVGHTTSSRLSKNSQRYRLSSIASRPFIGDAETSVVNPLRCPGGNTCGRVYQRFLGVTRQSLRPSRNYA